jgi:hypothetical protein
MLINDLSRWSQQLLTEPKALSVHFTYSILISHFSWIGVRYGESYQRANMTYSWEKSPYQRYFGPVIAGAIWIDSPNNRESLEEKILREQKSVFEWHISTFKLVF